MVIKKMVVTIDSFCFCEKCRVKTALNNWCDFCEKCRGKTALNIVIEPFCYIASK